jgi:hypothetical protein
MLCKFTGDLPRLEKPINIRNLGMPAPSLGKDFDFAIPSLGGERSDRPVRSGILLGSRTKRKPQNFAETAYLYMSGDAQHLGGGVPH